MGSVAGKIINSLVFFIKISFGSCSSVNNTVYLSILLIIIIIYTELFQLFFIKKDIKDYSFFFLRVRVRHSKMYYECM